jgi:hypothetical protein
LAFGTIVATKMATWLSLKRHGRDITTYTTAFLTVLNAHIRMKVKDIFEPRAQKLVQIG